MKIVLTRHGETDWNLKQIFRGRADVPLNETGLKQAGLLASALKALEIRAVYSSPLSRAFETAKIVAQPHNCEVRIVDDLIDIDYGQWQGLSKEAVKDKFSQLYQAWLESPEKVKFPAGENLKEVRYRTVKALERIISGHKEEETLAIVAHRAVNKTLICALLGLGEAHFWQIKQDPCAINIFLYENDRFILELYNDTCHLKELGKRYADF